MIDTSETYIKMCEKAEEIQECNKLMQGNYIANAKTGKVTVSSGKYLVSSKLIWLPRQDQLQEMVRESVRPLRLVTLFYEWLKEGETTLGGDLCFAPRNLDYNSFEQLWLAFVMKEKYNKVWDGSGWIST